MEGNSLGISGIMTTREKQVKLLVFGLMFSSQVKWLNWMQTKIIKAEVSPLSKHRQILFTKNIEAFEGLFYLPVALGNTY